MKLRIMTGRGNEHFFNSPILVKNGRSVPFIEKKRGTLEYLVDVVREDTLGVSDGKRLITKPFQEVEWVKSETSMSTSVDKVTEIARKRVGRPPKRH